ncbi:nuclear envelope phosphatase-regulatory subunit 1 isoform X2 [Lacerta agilis]|uniref:nuclear envelope phosphatase-regulatory subunit 1 isoform X2 n=1 Tax=Lacerta agilis TaxID=80427 RepID=UPI0014191D2E|nr:nuclear envelope phosphatase-regulatory subunit 1 isoform X2 [Lacerta agilis]
MNSLEQAEDLKAFERRLTEYIACLQPATGRWRIILIVVSVCTATGAWNWLIDPETQKVSFFTSLWNHPFFTVSCITLIDWKTNIETPASRPVTHYLPSTLLVAVEM